MRYNRLYSVEELTKEIQLGKTFLLAGDEDVLSKLPQGNWIGGTIPYFMADNGGETNRNKIFASELPSYCRLESIQNYDETSISMIYKNLPENGFGVVLIPAGSKSHLEFAMKAPEYEGFASKPLIGWITGLHLTELGKKSAKVFSGKTLLSSETAAVVMHISLSQDYGCEIGIVNIFSQGDGDVVEFPETGFTVSNARVNGKLVNFSEYVLSKNINTKLPLVANYAGAMINVSFQNVNQDKKIVDFYAPVFSGVKYKLTDIEGDYVDVFSNRLPKESEQILFTFNCILNYLHSELEGKKTAQIVGPMTFGEIAYQLLNQTLVYLKVTKL